MGNTENKINALETENATLQKELKRYKSNAQVFQALVGTAVGEIGEDFFNNIVIKLSEWLNAECVIIGQVIAENTVEGFPMYLDGEIIQGFTYHLENTPCDLTSKKGYCVFEDKANDLFPKSKDIQDLNILGYVGVALYNKQGNPNGILCAMSRKKLQLPPQAEDILRIVGARVTAEIERVKAQKALEVSEAELRIANASKDKLFSIISHDLKSSFNVLIGFSELISKNVHKQNIEKIAQYAAIINNISGQTYGLLKNLLEWSLSQTSSISFNPQKFNLTELINEVIEFEQHLAQQKNIALSSLVKDAVEIIADKNMVSTILINLLSNAIKFTNEGGEVTVDFNEKVITVADTGIGISSEDIQKLFHLESNYTKIGTLKEKGTGLGLILCKEFVDKHKGKIWVESEPEKGSRFCFTLGE